MKIDFTIEKNQNNETALKDESGRIINWPADLLPTESKAGDKITFNIGGDENPAKDILNEILNGK
jgi:hypothetical protein